MGEKAVRMVAGQDYRADPVVGLGAGYQFIQCANKRIVEQLVGRVRERGEEDAAALLDADRAAQLSRRWIAKPATSPHAIRMQAASRPASLLSSPMTAPLVPADMTEPDEAADIAEPNDAAEATENADAADPTDANEANEPTEPIDRNDPFEAIERNESSDQRLRVEPSSIYSLSTLMPLAQWTSTIAFAPGSFVVLLSSTPTQYTRLLISWLLGLSCER